MRQILLLLLVLISGGTRAQTLLQRQSFEGTGTVLLADEQAGLVACGHQEALQLDIVLLPEGYFIGAQSVSFGVRAGEKLETLPAAAASRAATPRT